MKCGQCGVETDTPRSLAWYALPWFLLFGIVPRARGLCRDCAGGQNFMALLATIAALLVAFVVAVIVL